MNNEELICAALVFELAHKIADSRSSAFSRTVEYDKENRDAKMREWNDANPTSNFVPDAYALLEKVSKQVSEIREAKST